MVQPIAHNFRKDEKGNPSGGVTTSLGVSVQWQDGPLQKDGVRQEPNGAFVETIIEIARDRIEFYNDSKFRCRENSIAITKLEEALHWLNARTARRTESGIEGTHSEDSTIVSTTLGDLEITQVTD